MALSPEDERHLRRAIELAGLSRANGNHPFGSLLVDGSGLVVAEAENSVVTGRDVTGHAELNLVRKTSAELDFASLAGTTLYTSTEPCSMCSGAIYWSGIGRVVYALGGDELNAIVAGVPGVLTLELPCREVFARGGRRVEVSGPHLYDEAAAVHQGFWG
jgi:tRNA(Arg) A34 adenosine deaminase TadA